MADQCTGYGTHGFVGRHRELASLHADVAGAGLDTMAGRPVPRSRVLLIAGRPGSGRSALAAELARQLTAGGGYPGGVLHARLTVPGGEPVPTGRTARRLLDTLGLRTAPGAGEEDSAQLLRAALAAREVLLLLDDAASPEQLLDLLPDTRGCLIIATARGPLTGVPGVRPCALGGLDREAAVALLARGAGEVRITVDPRAAEALAEECGGRPAALVLLAGWLAARPEASMADALLRLRAVPGDPLDRAFRFAERSLAPPTARLLRLLCLAPDGFVDAQLASALAGCTADAAQSALEELAALGLLRTAPPYSAPARAAPAHTAAAHIGPAYTVPGCLAPLLRSSLQEHERPAELLLARARMLERTVRQLQSCWARTRPAGSTARRRAADLPRSLRFGTEEAAAEWLRTRLPGLLAAVRLAVEECGGELDTLARRLGFALARALAAHRTPEDAAPELYRLHELMLTVARRRALHRAEAAALLALGDYDAAAGRISPALGRYRAALDAARAGDDTAAAGRALESLGTLHRDTGDRQRAVDWYGRALALRQTAGDLAGEARLHSLIAAVYEAAGRWGEALRERRAAAAVCRRTRDVPAYARALGEVARAQEGAGRQQESLRTRREAVEYARRSGDEVLRAELRRALAEAKERADDLRNI